MKRCITLSIFLLSCFVLVRAQSGEQAVNPHQLRFSGQLAGWGGVGWNGKWDAWGGGRYIPQFYYGYNGAKKGLFDFEGAARIEGEYGYRSKPQWDGDVKAYRFWARYSNKNSEIRLGLQKIDFGSAQLFRPLMWFNDIDPRDPLQITNGVWGGLYRYYFKNNANIWVWALAGNKGTKGWEMFETYGKLRPEVGGRAQMPFPSGEVALSYNFREADLPVLFGSGPAAEHRFGFDVRVDVEVGLWLEASWSHYQKELLRFSNQNIVTLGADYTFGVGNGLSVVAEHMLFGIGEKAFSFEEPRHFSGLSMDYPFGPFDRLRSLFYYDWKAKQMYSFLSWHRQYNSLDFYLIGYWNPKTSELPIESTFSRFTGRGLQIMVVWNH
jgi:hypothetical protein